MTRPVVAGARVQTNAAFAAMFVGDGAWAWRGAVVRKHPLVGPAWYVRVDNVPKLQVISEAFLEPEQDQ